MLFCINFLILTFKEKLIWGFWLSGFLRIWKRTCSIVEIVLQGLLGFFFNLRRIRRTKPSLIILEQYLRLYNVACEPTYALIEGSEVCQLN